MKISKRPEDKMREFLIVLGAMKCGSTSLFSYLGDHGNIAACSIKEPDYFSADCEWEKGFDYYNYLWTWDDQIHRYALEASVSYTKRHVFSNVVQRMLESQNNFKFIYIVRDPYERIESHYTHGIFDNWSIAQSQEFVDRHALDTTRYFYQLMPYIEAFGFEKILILDFEMLKSNTSACLKKICKFLELEPFESNTSALAVHNQNKSKRKYSTLGNQLSRYGAQTNLISRYLPSKFKPSIKNLVSAPAKRYKLTQNQKRYIAIELYDDTLKFMDCCGDQVNVANWEIHQFIE